MKTYWWRQLLVAGLLVVLAVGLDLYMRQFPPESSGIVGHLVLFLAVAAALVACNQLLFHYSQANPGFMKHRIWNKMSLVIVLWLLVSSVILVVLLMVTPLPDLIQDHLWMMYLIGIYFLFIMNLLALSVVHRLVEPQTTAERKLIYTWIAGVAVVAVSFFVV
ncbi:hypothetical protein ACFFIY_13830 [Bhargavaea ullalensis]|uniref:Uncharacterized protein n=1 Tax=Bhargavaea ullalensis TaxID=1265685 RepID=A0ABV2GEZ6_9BACL